VGGVAGVFGEGELRVEDGGWEVGVGGAAAGTGWQAFGGKGLPEG
jgi:hypothetical protein